MLTKPQRFLLALTCAASVFTASIHAAALFGPCDPAPPSHPLPAAVELPAPVVVPAAPVEPAPAAAIEVDVHQEPASTPMTAPSAK